MKKLSWTARGLLLALLVAASTLVPIGRADAAGTLTSHSISVGGVTRTYWKYIPNGLVANPSLVFSLHGTGSTGYENATESNKPSTYWKTLADQDKFVLLFPDAMPGDGAGTLGGATRWNDCRSDADWVDEDYDDVAFIDALITAMGTTHNVNLNKVYVSGQSSGGFMTHRLGMELSHRIAAIAPVIAGIPTDPLNECGDPTNPISVFVMNGDGDPWIPWGGGCMATDCAGEGTTQSAVATRDYWRTHNGTGGLLLYTYPNVNSADNSDVRRHRYQNGSQGTEVIMFQVRATGNNGAGHSTPSICCQLSFGEELLAKKQNHDIEGNAVLWGFLKTHTLTT